MPEEGNRSLYGWFWATMWLLGIELRTSERVASVLNHWAISPNHCSYVFNFFFYLILPAIFVFYCCGDFGPWPCTNAAKGMPTLSTYFFTLKYLFHLCVCMCIWDCVCVKPRGWYQSPWSRFQVIMSCLVVAGTDPGSSAKAVGALSHWLVSPALMCSPPPPWWRCTLPHHRPRPFQGTVFVKKWWDTWIYGLE